MNDGCIAIKIPGTRIQVHAADWNGRGSQEPGAGPSAKPPGTSFGVLALLVHIAAYERYQIESRLLSRAPASGGCPFSSRPRSLAGPAPSRASRFTSGPLTDRWQSIRLKPRSPPTRATPMPLWPRPWGLSGQATTPRPGKPLQHLVGFDASHGQGQGVVPTRMATGYNSRCQPAPRVARLPPILCRDRFGTVGGKSQQRTLLKFQPSAGRTADLTLVTFSPPPATGLLVDQIEFFDRETRVVIQHIDQGHVADHCRLRRLSLHYRPCHGYSLTEKKKKKKLCSKNKGATLANCQGCP